MFFPASRIHSFEPVNSEFTKLSRVYGSAKNVHVHPFACGDETRKTTIALTEASVCNSLRYEVDQADTTKKGTQEVQVVRIDEFLKSNQIDAIDILKTDTEGFDVKVLLGCGEILQDISYVLSEVGFHGQPNQSSFEAVNSLLTSNGFRFAGLYDASMGPRPDLGVAFANALFARRTIL